MPNKTHSQNPQPSLGAEAGFTLIELLTTMAIISILSGLAISTYFLYRENAEYSKGVATLRNARTAYGAGELELPEGYSMAFTQTGVSGGNLSGELSRVLPGANTPGQVRLGAEVNQCDEGSDPLDRAAFIVSEPCLSEQEVRWQKFCGGIEILSEHVANAAPCT